MSRRSGGVENRNSSDLHREEPELNTGPQPVVLGSPFGSIPAETFVRVGPRVRIRFPPSESPSLSGFHPRFRVAWRRGVSRDPAVAATMAENRRFSGVSPT